MKNTTKTILVIMSLLVLSALVGLWFLISHVQQASSKLQTTLETIANEQEVASDQRTLSALLESTADDRGILESRIIQGESGTITFLSEIDDFAASQNITLITSSLDVALQARKPYDSLDISYNVSGSEVSIKKFIKLLETMPYSSEVVQLSFVRTVDEVTGVREANANIAVRISMINI